MYVRYLSSLRNVEDLLHERGIDICHETVRLWWACFGPMFAALQQFDSVHGTFHNHLNHKRQVIDRETYKERRSAALAVWRAVAG